jgi:hypothetical protein
MRRTHSLGLVILAACATAAISCVPDAVSPSVEFGASGAVGSWKGLQDREPTDASVDAAADEAQRSDASVQPAAAGRSGVGTADASAGTGGMVASTPRGASGASGASGAADGGGAGGADASPNDAGVVEPPSTAVTSLRFEVTTSAVGGRYQPKNIGAIWIEDDGGAVIKTLEVWAKTRRRYLTGYLGAMAGGTVDVTASATLSRHQTHTVTWDLKDKAGNVVMPGAYRLRMELTDRDSAGRSHVVDFDTRQGAMTLTPPDAPSFGALQIALQ